MARMTLTLLLSLTLLLVGLGLCVDPGKAVHRNVTRASKPDGGAPQVAHGSRDRHDAPLRFVPASGRRGAPDVRVPPTTGGPASATSSHVSKTESHDTSTRSHALKTGTHDSTTGSHALKTETHDSTTRSHALKTGTQDSATRSHAPKTESVDSATGSHESSTGSLVRKTGRSHAPTTGSGGNDGVRVKSDRGLPGGREALSGRSGTPPAGPEQTRVPRGRGPKGRPPRGFTRMFQADRTSGQANDKKVPPLGEWPSPPFEGSVPQYPQGRVPQYPQGNAPPYPRGNYPSGNAPPFPAGSVPNYYPTGNAPPYPSGSYPYPDSTLPYPSKSNPNYPPGGYPSGNVPPYPTGSYPPGSLPPYPQGSAPPYRTGNYPSGSVPNYPQGSLPPYPHGNYPSERVPPYPQGNYPSGSAPPYPQGSYPSENARRNAPQYHTGSNARRSGPSNPPRGLRWIYHGTAGITPEKWGFAFPQCGGYQQSPVDLPAPSYYGQDVYGTAQRLFVTPFLFYQFDDMTLPWMVTNDGHTVEVTPLAGHMMVRGGGLDGSYGVDQFHFHWPAEHTIQGYRYAMEMHVVTHNSQYSSFKEALHSPAGNGVSVLAVLFEVSFNHNWAFDTLIQEMRKVPQPGSRSSFYPQRSLNSLMPGSWRNRLNGQQFYRYQGSLTTPPCTESVTWTVFKETVKISQAQLNEFTQLVDSGRNRMNYNYRPAQPLNNRAVYFSEIVGQGGGGAGHGGGGERRDD